MDPGNRQLVSLLIALFEIAALERLVRSHYGEKLALSIDWRGSPTHVVQSLVDWLSEKGEVDEELFALLRANRPERSEDIERVRRELLDDQDEPEVPEEVPEIATRKAESAGSEEARTWRARMKLSLEGVADEREAPRAWVEAAAVLPHFVPARLRPVGPATEGSNGLVELASVCEHRADGRWSLKESLREETIARLWKEGRLLEAVDANAAEAPGPHVRLLRKIAADGEQSLDLLDPEEQAAAAQVGDWFARTGFEPVDQDRLASLLERRQRIEPLRKLVGKHFRGRDDELARLRAHLDPRNEGPAILALWGVGGVGKSTLLGKVLLDFEDAAGFPRPWVYLDFDDPAMEPTHPRKLIESIARQLSLLYASATASEAFLGLESLAGGDRALEFTLDLGPEVSVEQLIRALDEQIRRLPINPSLTIVLDTFEMVQVRGRHTVAVVRSLLDKIVEVAPYARIIASGRGEVQFARDNTLQLEDLDLGSADAVLEALGIKRKSLRGKIVDIIGRSPLSLRLAAGAILTKQLKESDLEELVSELSQVELQGQLYTRILGHVPDGEVKRLAHPGLIVRRVTTGVIRDVLAQVCDIRPERVDPIFERLPDHVSLFGPDEAAPGEEAALRHRQDVRQIMLRLMLKDPEWHGRMVEIHRAAIRHYAGRSDPISRAETVYHHLMLDDDPEQFDALWGEELRTSLGRCWEEPLPERARRWLAPRINRSHADADGGRLVDWEVSAISEVKSHLATNDAAGALEILGQREERTPGSPLRRLEAQALSRLGRLDEAAQACERAIESAVAADKLDEALRSHIVAGGVALAAKDGKRLREHAKRALRLAERLEDDKLRLLALLLFVRGDRAIRKTKWSKQNVANLVEAFAKTDPRTLREEPALSQLVVNALGEASKIVLRKAASTFGNRSSQDVIKQDAFQLEGLLTGLTASDKGKQKLAKLAEQVGLSSKRFELIDLAGHAIKFDKMGDALELVLNENGDDQTVRKQAFSLFKLHEPAAEYGEEFML